MVAFPQLAARSASTSHGRTGPRTVTSRLWYRFGLRDGLIRARHVPMIRKHVADALGAAGWPDGACLFLSTARPRGKRARESASAAAEAVFFSPAAIAAVPHLIAVCGAEPSPPPERACATLLVGQQSDWDLLPCGTH
jgi:hypothetical protein